MKKHCFASTFIIFLCITTTVLASEDISTPSIQDAQSRAEVFHSKPLQIACNYLDASLLWDYAKTYPEAVVNHISVLGTQAASLFAEQMNTQSDEIDIFELPVGATTQRAFKKGYYYPLNKAPVISKKISSYHSFFQKTAMNGNDIAAIPKTVEQRGLAYSQYALEQLELRPEDIPTTYEGMLDFLSAWDERVGNIAAQKEITPFGVSNLEIKTEWFNMFLDQYYALLEEAPEKMDAYKAELAVLLDKLTLVCNSMPPGTGGGPIMPTGEPFTQYRVNEQPSYLFTLNGSFHPGRRSFSHNRESVSDFVPLALTLPSQSSPLLMFEGSLFIINPYSSQKEQALHLLNYYMEHAPPAEEAAFDPHARPIESEAYKILKRNYTANIKEWERRIETAEGSAKLELEERLRLRQMDLRGIERIKWEISSRWLEDYEKAFSKSKAFWIDPTLYVSSFNQIYSQYLNEGMAGNIVSEKFFDTYGMVLLENH